MSVDLSAWLLAGCLGVLAALPLARRARAATVTDRTSRLSGTDPDAGLVVAAATRLRRFETLRLVAARAGIVGRVLSGLARRRRQRRADALLRSEVPVAVDLVGVAVGAGCTPYLAVRVAGEWAPERVGAVLASVGQLWDMGATFSDAMSDVGVRHRPLRALSDALIASDRLGAPVGPALGRISAEARADTRREAEQRARALPVRLLFPLVFLVLPAFGLLTVAPALLSGLART
ncbi:MAG: type II secretion system F family protein [Acidimicrobiia bacterium]|nr:type II secretion system F family protein [Acidimicrobiia bacterium]